MKLIKINIELTAIFPIIPPAIYISKYSLPILNTYIDMTYINKSGIISKITYTIEVKIDLLSFILNILKNNDEYSKQVIIVFIVPVVYLYTRIFSNIKPNNINTSIIMFLCLRFTMIILPNVYKVNISNVLLNSILKLSDNLLQPLSC